MRTTIPFLAAAFVLAAAVHAQTDRKLTHGADVQVVTMTSESIRGELLAATRDSVWVLASSLIRAVAMRDVMRVRIDRGGHGAGYGMARSLIFGAVSGVALSSACSSIESSGCGVVFAASVGASALIGALAAPSLQRVRYLTLQAPSAGELRDWARFPQGIPEGVREMPARPGTK